MSECHAFVSLCLTDSLLLCIYRVVSSFKCMCGRHYKSSCLPSSGPPVSSSVSVPESSSVFALNWKKSLKSTFVWSSSTSLKHYEVNKWWRDASFRKEIQCYDYVGLRSSSIEVVMLFSKYVKWLSIERRTEENWTTNQDKVYTYTYTKCSCWKCKKGL